jgi:hypothetical protein
MLVRQACHKHHRKHVHDSPAAAAVVVRESKSMESREEHMQGHAGRARFSKRSNKEACSMKAQLHEAHMSMQEGVAGLPGISQVFKHGS